MLSKIMLAQPRLPQEFRCFSLDDPLGKHTSKLRPQCIHQRLAPIFLALRDAALQDPACAQLWTEIAQRRARNMRDFAADLRATGELRNDLTNDDAADIIWSMNAVEYWVLLIHERHWTTNKFRQWLTDAWIRLLLQNP